MKRNVIVALTMVALSLLTISSFAQNKVKADVPFAFRVGNVSLPAGSYTVRPAADHAFLLQNGDAGSAILSTYRNDERLKASAPKMVFHKYGDTYILVEIWDASGTEGMVIPETKLEKELRASNSAPASGELVVVAMK